MFYHVPKLIGYCSRILICGFVAASLFTTANAATVSEKGLYAAGDKLLTTDSATNLDWLDLTQTAGQNYNDVLAGSFVMSQGFRYATKSEVETLFGSFDIPGSYTGQGSVSAAKFAPVTVALDFLGELGVSGSRTFSQGMYDEGTTSGVALLQLDPDNLAGALGQALLSLRTGRAYTYDYGGFSGIGSYLVRDVDWVAPVPLPAAFPLFAGGLGLLGLLGWRRKRTAAAV